MNTHESYVSLETAKLLKEAGFNWEVNHSYSDCSSLDNSCSGYMEELSFYHNINDCKYGGMSAPTLDVAQRWLREVKNINIEVKILSITSGQLMWYAKIYYLQKHNGIYDQVEFIQYTEISHDSYEQALEAGMQKSLTILLEGK